MAQKFLEFNISGILIVGSNLASLNAVGFDRYELKIEYEEVIKLAPPLKVLSRWNDERVIATYQSDVQPGKIISVRIGFVGGFYDKKKDPWGVIWRDKRIKEMVMRSIEHLAVKVGHEITTFSSSQHSNRK